ncbi:RluA family pseudouridine synthase [Rubrivirga litoralis]|uniref:RluA family pseudouridine synthase n=1 Tax=Rubrivirga litoralis TaxID=3075598 RepID=A0ABU3BNL5_9BACT|nr:RluA family pseudouridine synthase [Rubrivirga sp. F394]MDT0630882.1 RluA family pseudouridine synthase [Rubrivirga sp. F394]
MSAAPPDDGPPRPAPTGGLDPGEAPFRVVYLDNHLLVVSKPPGLLAQGDATGDADLVTLAKAYLKERFDKPGNVFVGLVHRLDRPTSGVVALARTSKAASRLSDQFRRRAVQKRYLAVVDGRLNGAGRREDWLSSAGGAVAVVAEGAPGAKRAALSWRVLASRADRTLVDVDLETGRKHQIRVQLAALGAPVLGDFRYGNRTPFAGGRGIALHAYRLTLEHPTRREPLTFTAPPPPAWDGLFDAEVAEAVGRGGAG